MVIAKDEKETKERKEYRVIVHSSSSFVAMGCCRARHEQSALSFVDYKKKAARAPKIGSAGRATLLAELGAEDC